MKLSPKGNYLASTARDASGVISLSVMDLSKGKIISITRGRGNESVSSFNWLNNDRLLLTMAREVGSFEQPLPTGELIAMDADGSKQVILTGPRTDNKDNRFSQIIDYLPNEPDQVLIYSVGWSSANPYLDIYRMKVTTGRRKGMGRIPLKAYRGTQVNVYTNNEGVPLVATGVDPKQNNKLVIIARTSKDAEWKTILETQGNEGEFAPAYLADDNRTLVGVSNLKTNTMSLATFDIISKEHKVLLTNENVDLTPIRAIKNGIAGEVVGAAHEYKKFDLTFLDNVEDKKSKNLVKSLVASFPEQSVVVISATEGNKKMIIRTFSANHPSVFYLFDNEKRQLAQLTQSAPWLKSDIIPTTQIISYKSRDGIEITGLLTLPKDKSKNLPLIMLPHGGPHGVRDSVLSMDSDSKVFAMHGYAVFQPNFRGSGGFGKDFLTKGYKKWGTEMIDDMTDGVNYLIDQGIVNKEKMCTYGASYGGYAAVQSVIREPNMYKCAVGFVGVYDLEMMFTKGDVPENESGINFLNTIMPNAGKDRDFQSPVKNVDKIQVPVYIIQGEEDVRVPKEHAFALRDELKKMNKPYQWMMKPGEGHGFYKPENNIERWTEMLKFFDKHMNN